MVGAIESDDRKPNPQKGEAKAVNVEPAQQG